MKIKDFRWGGQPPDIAWHSKLKDYPIRVFFDGQKRNPELFDAEELNDHGSKTGVHHTIQYELMEMQMVDVHIYATLNYVVMYCKEEGWDVIARLQGRNWLLKQLVCVDYQVERKNN